MELRFSIEREDIKQCFSFAKTILGKDAQSTRDFGSIRRNLVDAASDTVEGKLAELVFQRFLQRNFDIQTEVDFEIYPSQRAVDFGQDVEKINRTGSIMLNPCRVDVKATRAYSKWLLVEGHKFWADAYVSVVLSLPRDFEKSPDLVEKAEKVEAKVSGFAYYFDLVDPHTKEPWFSFERGDALFDPNELLDKALKDAGTEPAIWKAEIHRLIQSGKLRTMGGPLKAERNYGLPLAWLRTSEDNWKGLVKMCTGSLLHVGDQVALTRLEIQSKKP